MKKSLVIILASCLVSSVFAASLKGSPESMALQNREADREDLSRLTEGQLEIFKKNGSLVPLLVGSGIVIDPRLPERYRWCRPCTRDYLVDLKKDFKHEFERPFQINSAVRSIEYQKGLTKRNGNAASASPGLHQSSHLTGATVDIAKIGLSGKQLQWMQNRLLADEKKGLVEATEEHHQAVFHVMVFQTACEK